MILAALLEYVGATVGGLIFTSFKITKLVQRIIYVLQHYLIYDLHLRNMLMVRYIDLTWFRKINLAA